MLLLLYWPQYLPMAHTTSELCVTELCVTELCLALGLSSFQSNSLSIIYPILSQLVYENIMGDTVESLLEGEVNSIHCSPSPT